MGRDPTPLCVPGTWYVVPGILLYATAFYLVPGTWYLVYDKVGYLLLLNLPGLLFVFMCSWYAIWFLYCSSL